MSFDEIIIWVMAVGLLIGAADKIIGNKFGLGEKFDEGFNAMGPLALGMVGIVCLAPVISKVLGPVIIPVFQAMGADPAMFAATLANDMGGYSLAMELAQDEQAGLLAGNVIASMLGCTLVFSIPVGLGLIEKEDQVYFSRGLLIGLITIPVGSILGGAIAGFPLMLVLKNVIPILIFSLLLILGLKLIPDKMIKGCMVFGQFITIVIYIGLAAAAFEHLTGVVLIPGMAPIMEGMDAIAGIGIVLLGTFPVLTIITKVMDKPLNALGQKIGLDAVSAAGLVFTLANSVPVYTMMKDMRKKGIIVNTAWLVPATAALGDHLGFTAGVQPGMITPVVLGKIAAGILAIILALIICKNMEEPEKIKQEHTQYFPEPGWVEHDPMEIWSNILETIDMACNEAGISKESLTCIGLDNQGETVMLWDRISGVPVYNAIVWQDRRTAKEADEIAAGYGDMIREKTGLIADAYFSATKIKWIIDHVEGVKEKIEKGRVIAGTLDTWMIWKLTHGKVCVTDYSTASRTMLLNIHTGEWDEEILDALGIPKEILPDIHDSAQLYGYTDPLDFFGASIPISGSVVDQQAALFGQACFKEGTVKTTYGTGCFMLMNTGNKPVYSKNGLLTTVGWGLDGKKLTFALDGGIYIAGAAVQWLRDKLKIIEHAAETEDLAKSVSDTGGVFFVPAFAGLAAPHWDSYARGTLVGVTGGTERAHIARATLESMAYQVKDNLDVMEKDSGIPIKVMRVDGGAVANDFLMQFQADILGIPVEVPVITDTTALGAAYLAAYGIGEFHNIEELERNWKLYKRYEPKMDAKTREELLYQWHRAVERAKGWIETKREVV